MENPALKSAYEKAIQKPARVSTLKAGKASKAIKDKKLSAKMDKVQEKVLDTKSIDGDWLILGDRSGSMYESIEIARNVAAFLARTVKGEVHLVFFNTSPIYFNVTGKSLDKITQETTRLTAGGGTAIGCGLELMLEKNISVNGIAVCSDGGDNTPPWFHNSYKRYCEKLGIEPTVYLYHVSGEENRMTGLCRENGIMLDVFEMGRNVDYYSIPQLALTMRTGRYTLVEEIMDTRLLTFNDVFGRSL